MERFTFRGGIHPYDGKDLSKDKPIRNVLPKGELAYLVSQHIGAPAVPIVKKGDHILVGQKIAEAGGFVCSADSRVRLRNSEGNRAPTDNDRYDVQCDYCGERRIV